jgi:hypothetical protein
MSMSTTLVGIKPADERYRQMEAVWNACEAAGIEKPAEVERFFLGSPPEPTGIVVELEHWSQGGTTYTPGVSPYRTESGQGYEVNLEKLRAAEPDVKVLRFVNSW